MKFKVEVTRQDSVNIEFNERYFNEKWFEDFREYFYDYFTLEELAEYISYNIVENNARFIEGIGIPLFDGKIPYLQDENDKQYLNEHVNVIFNSYNGDIDYEVTEIKK